MSGFYGLDESLISRVFYVTATGTANSYSVAINSFSNGYVEGVAIAVKINVTNTGPSTLNVNGLGAITIKKPNGNDVSAGNLKAGSIYTLRYNGTNFILQGEGGGGTAQPGDVLSGKTFTNDTGDQTGTMPNNGAMTITPGTNNVAIPAGYHNGAGYVVGDPNLVPGNIKSGVSVFGVAGNLIPTANPANGTQQWTTPGSYSWTVPSGVYRIMVAFVGGGGGANRDSTTGTSPSGGGGGGGGIILANVTPGQVINFTVGAGGTGAVSGATAGGTTSILGFSGYGGSPNGSGGGYYAPSSFSGYYFVGYGGSQSSINQSYLVLPGAYSQYTGIQAAGGCPGASPIAGPGGAYGPAGTGWNGGNGGIGSGGGATSFNNSSARGGNGGNGAVQIWW